MTRLAGEPPEDSLVRSSFALSRSWYDRLIARKDLRVMSTAALLRRWITMDEWMEQHTGPSAAEPLFILRTDGVYERVRTSI